MKQNQLSGNALKLIAALSMLLDHRMILRREEYQSVSEWVKDIASVTKTFLAQLHE